MTKRITDMEVLATQDDDQQYRITFFVLIETLAIQVFLVCFYSTRGRSLSVTNSITPLEVLRLNKILIAFGSVPNGFMEWVSTRVMECDHEEGN